MNSAKHRRLVVMSMLLLSFFLICGSAEAEVTYLGEICIYNNMGSAIGRPPDVRMKLGVLYYGNGHFVLNGYGGSTLSPDTVSPIYGTGVVAGNTFVATLTSSLVGATNTSFTVSHLVLTFGTGGDTNNNTLTEMTFDLSQPTAQSKVTTIPIYMMVCSP